MTEATASRQLPFARDAAIVLGLASTALPFARDSEAEVERWLRVLRLHGEAGAALQALGVGESPLQGGLLEPAAGAPTVRRHPGREETGMQGGRDAIALVGERGRELAERRGAECVTTADILAAVMLVYGGVCDRVLLAHGTDRTELSARLGVEL